MKEYLGIWSHSLAGLFIKGGIEHCKEVIVQ
jgi:hypothetical protein